MKNLKLFLGILFVVAISFVACEKEEVTSNVTTTSDEVIETTVSKEKIINSKATRKKIKIRSGRPSSRWGNCPYSLPCGPCAGICIRFIGGTSNPIPLDVSYTLTPQDITDNNSLLILEEISANQMLLSLTDNTDLIIDGQIEFNSNEDLGPDVAVEFGFNSLVIQEGVYVVDFDSNPEGDIIVDITTN
ncbi:MAG: hypothetical protein ACJASF_000810 [Vicingaceae bacterium]|jgi:hypothetical protein